MANTLVIADVKVVFPWSIWPIVPTLIWGLSLTYFAKLNYGTNDLLKLGNTFFNILKRFY